MLKVKSIVLIISSISILFSCNLIEWYENHNIKSLSKKGIEQKSLVTDSLNMKYYIGGKGPAILFIHGFGGDALLSWKEFMKKYSKTNTVLMADILWFGKSYAKYEANLQSQGRAFKELLEYLKIDSVSVIGQSYGGFIAMELKMQIPDKIKDLIIVNSPGPTFDTSYLDSLCIKKEVDKIEDFFVFDNYRGVNELIELGYNKKGRVPKSLAIKTYNKYFKDFKNEKKSLLKDLHKNQERMFEYYDKNKPKGLVIWSDADIIFPLVEGKKLAKYLEVEIKVIKKSGHVSIIDKTKKGFEILDNYFTNQ